MNDEPFGQSSTTRPYTCRGCGVAMRVYKGAADGYCAQCLQPNVTCAGYESSGGIHYKCGRVIVAGRGEQRWGQCVACGALQAVAQETRRARAGRRVERMASAPGGLRHVYMVDPFEGMHEEDKRGAK
jgi:hypothetical protein